MAQPNVFYKDSHYYGHISFSLADLVPDVQIKENQTFCGPAYFVTAKTQAPKFYKGWQGHQGTCSPQTSDTDPICQNSPPVEGQAVTEIAIPFPTRALAEAASKTFSELIRMSADIQ